MSSLSRTTSVESVTTNQKSQSDTQAVAADLSGPPSPAAASRGPQSLGATGRTPSHSLLTSGHNGGLPNRKGRFADVGTVGGNIGRASISMPPPANKPSSIYKPFAVRRPTAAQNTIDIKGGQALLDGTVEQSSSSDLAGMEDLEKSTSSHSVPTSEPQSPSGLPDSGLKPSYAPSNKPGDRLSLSSIYSLGSAIYSGATGTTNAPTSTASSTAGSVKSDEHQTPIVPCLSSSPGTAMKGEVATTATDPISVTANSQPSHQGSRLASG